MCIALWDTVLFAYACRPIYFNSVRACAAILQLECARLPVSWLLVILAVQKQSVIPLNIANWYVLYYYFYVLLQSQTQHWFTVQIVCAFF